ncbi:hypothetical protein EV715DRAFT_297541 [Schizophyllum commune]
MSSSMLPPLLQPTYPLGGAVIIRAGRSQLAYSRSRLQNSSLHEVFFFLTAAAGWHRPEDCGVLEFWNDHVRIKLVSKEDLVAVDIYSWRDFLEQIEEVHVVCTREHEQGVRGYLLQMAACFLVGMLLQFLVLAYM